MNLRYAILPAACLVALLTSAQQLEWLNSAPVGWTSNYQMPNHLVRASTNGLVGGTRQFGPGMSFGTEVFNSVYIDWIDPLTGIPFASCAMADSLVVESIAVGNDGTIYVAGRFMGGIEFCDGNAAGGTNGFLDTDMFLAAFNGTTFGVAWVRNLSMTHPDAQRVPALEFDANGTLWYGLEEFETLRLISLDAAGNDDEEITINGTRSLGGFGFDPWNNLFVAGSTGDIEGPLVFGGLSVPVAENYGLFVLRIRADGTGHWAEVAHAETFHNPDVAVDPWGKAFISSEIMDSTSFGGLVFNGPNWAGDVFIAQVDSSGEFIWGRESSPAGVAITGDMRQSRMRSIDCDAAGNVYLTGTVRGQTQWGNGVVSDAITLGAYAQTVVAFNNEGLAQWAVTSLPGQINAQAVSCDAVGVVYFTAHTNGPYTITPTSVNNGGMQAFVDGRIGEVSTSSAEFVRSGVMIYPVPAGDFAHVVLSMSTGRVFELLTSTGQQLRTILLSAGPNTIDVADLDAGVYLLRSTDGVSVRIVKE